MKNGNTVPVTARLTANNMVYNPFIVDKIGKFNN